MSLVSKKDLFIEKVKQIYPDSWQEMLEVLDKPRQKTLRKVTLLGDTSFSFSYTDGPFPNSFIVGNQEEPGLKNPHIYIQGLASMIPALVANCVTGESVLDLCAAPGSKSSQIANMANDQVYLTCLDNNTARVHALRENLESQNIHNFTVVKADAATVQYNPNFYEKFDKVLADVPCSNEGNIRLYDDKLLENWNPKLAKKISMLQKRILASGIKSLKKGGRLIYSTCTYSVEENEEVVDWALKHFKDVQLEKISLPLSNIVVGKTAFGKKKFDSSLEKTIRILPNNLFDGFFVASLLKL